MSDEQEEVKTPIKPVFDNDDRRHKTIDLQWPFTYDGKRIDRVVIKRMTQAEVAGFVEAVKIARESGSTEDTYFPMFYDTDGFLLSDDIMRAMDADDNDALNEVAGDFLPRRFAPKEEAKDE
jgi:hypothetical protein